VFLPLKTPTVAESAEQSMPVKPVSFHNVEVNSFSGQVILPKSRCSHPDGRPQTDDQQRVYQRKRQAAPDWSLFFRKFQNREIRLNRNISKNGQARGLEVLYHPTWRYRKEQ